MKNIETILSDFGVSLPDDKKESFGQVFNENYKTISEVEKLRAARDTLKTQLETAQNALKDFEGVDINELSSKIAQLNNDLAAKDDEFNKKIAEMEFDSKIENMIIASGAKNSKAVRALLDVESLRSSENQDNDIKNAIEKCKEENGYMFGLNEPINNPVAPTEGNPSLTTLSGVEKAFFAKNPELKQ